MFPMSEPVHAPVDDPHVEPTPSLTVEAGPAAVSASAPPLPEPEHEHEHEPMAAPATTLAAEPELEQQPESIQPSLSDNGQQSALAASAPVDEIPEAYQEEEPEAAAEAVVEPAPEPEPVNLKHWYVVKVQSGREDTIKEAIERRMRKEGLEEYFGQIVIPVEKYTEIKTDKNGKRVSRTKERKLYPGYLMVEVEYNDRILYLFRETSGVGDFVGAHPGDLTRAPTPMSDNEVKRMIGPMHGKDDDKEPVSPKPKWLQEGDRVRVVDGTFNSMEGTVKHILESVSKVQVTLSIFGRPVDVDLEYYQVEQL
jgi:transcriptional antiterminator NusG